MDKSETPTVPKARVNRRDPAKRRVQNRQAQKVYREKQKKRIQELERMAAGTEGAMTEANAIALPLASRPIPDPQVGAIDPCYLQAEPQDRRLWNHDLFPDNLDQWLSNSQASTSQCDVSSTFFSCGCPILHIPMPPSRVLLPAVPDIYSNTLRINQWCVIAALHENCAAIGIPPNAICCDDGFSLFFRPEAAEGSVVVASAQRYFRALKYDLRPTTTQIIKCHHPYIDVIPFRDIRDNLIAMMDEIDEDEFFHDCMNHLRCWGSVSGARASTPWDGRSWEASEAFLAKWTDIVGGEDGELTRSSRWWRSMRGESIVEVS